MNELSNYLVETFLLQEAVTQKVVVYGGRFQPFHAGHYKTYKHLCSVFGAKNVYIASSNVQETGKSPLSFNEKRDIAVKVFGISPSKFIQVKNVYQPVEILRDFDSTNTAIIVALGEKDSMRLGGQYFKPYTNDKDLEGYMTRGYVYSKTPSNSFGATDIRNMFRSNLSADQKEKQFQKFFGKYNKDVFQMLDKGLNEEKELIPGGLSKGMTLAQISDKHKVDLDTIKKEFKKGVNTEMEHTTDIRVAAEIAKDHIFEDPKYYDKLVTIEGDIDYEPDSVDWDNIMNMEIADPATGKKYRIKDALQLDRKEFARQEAMRVLRVHALMDKRQVPGNIEKGQKSPKSDKVNQVNLGLYNSYGEGVVVEASAKGSGYSPKILNQLVKNPESGEDIKVSSALNYDTNHPAYKSAMMLIAKDGDSDKQKAQTPAVTKSGEKDIKASPVKVAKTAVSNPKAIVRAIGQKISKWSKKEKEFFRGAHKAQSKERRSFGKWIADKADGIVKGVVREAKHLGHELKTAGEGFKSVFSGGKPNEEQKKAMIGVAKTVGLTVASMVLSGGVSAIIHHGTATLMGHLGTHLAEHMVGEVILGGAVKAALYAGVENITDETYIEYFTLQLADNIMNGAVPAAVWAKTIDSYNKDKEEGKVNDKDWEGPNEIHEVISLDVNVGDTLLMGKFKNKKVKVKEIGTDEYGMPTINGKKATTFRIPKADVNEMAKADMDKVEKYADSQLSPEDVVLGKETDHFFQRLNDPRNGKEITPAELTGFFKRLAKNKKKFLEFIKQYNEFVVKDKRTGINIPFMVQANKLIAKTIMRKDDFKSITPIYVSEQIVNEDVKWQEDTYRKCMLGKLPLSLNIVKQLVEPIRTTSLHATDVENLQKVAALQGTKKSISTFTKTTKWGKLVQGKGMHTKGGILVALSGVVLAQSIMDLWTEPDKQGRRWVNPGTVISGLGREQDVVFNLAPELKKYKERWKEHSFDGTITNAEKAEFIKKYYDAAEKYMLSKKKEFQDKYLNSNKLYYDSDWNEVVLTDIKIEKILAVPSNWSDDEVENEKTLKQLKQKYKNVEVADKESEIQNFIKQNGGSIIEYTNQTKDLIMEGGAYGHMNHPFDTSINLTFKDLKTIVTKALDGNLGIVREKTDGQALAISWKNGRLIAARNKSHLSNGGEGALDAAGIASKFGGRGGLTDAYNFAMKDLESALRGLGKADLDKIFQNGKVFMNLEVIFPTSVNVIPYGQALLVFHNAVEYNEAGNAIGVIKGAESKLGALVKKINADVQSKYTIQGPPITKLPKNDNLSSLKPKYLSQISKLQSEFGLSDSAGVADYHQAWWKDYIKKSGKKLEPLETEGLIKRWAFDDKSFRLNTIADEKARVWADGIEKQSKSKIAKDNLMKFEEIFLGVGSDVLSFMSSVLTASPDRALQQMRSKLDSAIGTIRATGDASQIQKLELELQRLNSIGGFDKIVPNEGIIFNYKGNVFKMTGAFASLNQLLGILYH